MITVAKVDSKAVCSSCVYPVSVCLADRLTAYYLIARTTLDISMNQGSPPPPSYAQLNSGGQQQVDGKALSAYDPTKINQTPQPGMGEYSYSNQGASSNYGAAPETHWESRGPLTQSREGTYNPAQMSIPPPPPPVGLHQYRGPRGDIITSQFPPGHPEMQCLQKGHKPKTEFGLVGVVCGIVCFPLGCIVTAMDRRVVCKRCGLVMDHGVFSG